MAQYINEVKRDSEHMDIIQKVRVSILSIFVRFIEANFGTFLDYIDFNSYFVFIRRALLI